jgi:hypothetical protein
MRRLTPAGRYFYVIADDELQLAVFDCDGETPGSLACGSR